MTFSELKMKDVVNILDGKKLGRPIDVCFTEDAAIDAIVVPEPFSFINCLKQEKTGYMIPWTRVRRIGDDVILVETENNGTSR